MLGCKHCELLKSENDRLRGQNDKLLDRLMAMANAQAFGAIQFAPDASNDFYGSPGDEELDYNDYGQRIVKKKEEPQ